MASHVGRFGTAEVFSFSPTKLVVAGEGGLVATRDAGLAEKLRAARNYGDAGNSDPEILGVNARMSEINAAMALRGLAGLDARIDGGMRFDGGTSGGFEMLRGFDFRRFRKGAARRLKIFQ